MSWKRMIFGEKTPDKNDPQYKERYHREVEAGRKAARFLKLDKLCAKIQTFALTKPNAFLTIIISIMLLCLSYNVYCLVRIFSNDHNVITATEIQRQRLEMRKAKDAELRQKVKSETQSQDIEETQSDSADEEVFESEDLISLESLTTERDNADISEKLENTESDSD